ncbi:hypothetical protein CSPX01_12049 [Colletotrichum filicis]|nr:hypothetical protein CSPX01_12049 [Colletotrichum filicis]
MPLIPSASIQTFNCLDLTQSQFSGTLYFHHFTSALHDLFACSLRSSSTTAVSLRSFQRVPVCPLFSLARGRPWSTVHWGATGLGLRNRLEPFALQCANRQCCTI